MIFGLPSSLLWRWSSPIVRGISESIWSEPEKWVSERGYWLDSDNPKVSIWVANSAYGLYFHVGYGLRAEQISPSWPERELIWRAVKRLKVQSPTAFSKQRALQIFEGAPHG